jgi:hypothetical protein
MTTEREIPKPAKYLVSVHNVRFLRYASRKNAHLHM